MLDEEGLSEHGSNMRAWSEQAQGAMLAEAWVSAVAVQPG